MTKDELEQWLCGSESRVPTPRELADGLGLPFDAVADTTLLRTVKRLSAVRFTIATLQDLYPDDDDVRAWLRRPHATFGGRCALDLLIAGRTRAVEELVVGAWHERTVDV